MTAIRENGAASGLGVIATITYDDLGRRTGLTRGNGVATTYAYDPVSRLDELKLDFSGTTDDLTSTFAYNPASQIAGNTRSNDLYAWTGHGSGTTSTTADGRNRIASWVNTLGYDAKGNIAADGTYSYAYSSENLLTSLANSATGALQPSIAFAYDPLMRLAVIDSTNAGFDVQFGYDGQEMVYEGLSDNRTRRYVYGPGVDEPLVGYLVTGTGTSRVWYQADERGSIARLSNDSGTPGGTGKFDEYGIGGTSRFRYTGQYWLGEANLLYYRARIYDPKLGRFLQPDPIGYGSGMNLYAYVKGDPVNGTDPTGLGTRDETVADPTIRKPVNLGVIYITGDLCRVMNCAGGDLLAMSVVSVPLWGMTRGEFESGDSKRVSCPIVQFRITGIGPRQATGTTSISQQPGSDIDPKAGGVAIKPQNFGVPDVSGGRGDVLQNIILIPMWHMASDPPGAPAIPVGLPSRGPYHPIDTIGPASARNAPGNHIDLYRYSSQNQAARSTRTVPVLALVPENNEGVRCPDPS